jgi:long-chain acyl-CoA synthetase
METTSAHAGVGTFPALLLDNARRLGEGKIAFREKDYGIWQSYTWPETLTQCRDFALGLAALGFRRDDRICIVGDNRPELYWGMVAAQSLGGVPVPLYQDSIEREMQFIVEHAEARFALVEDQEQVDKMLGIKEQCPRLEVVIYKDPRGLRNYREDYLLSFKAVQEQGRAFAQAHPGYLEAEIAKVGPDDLSVICYTSGTTGRPKGVMLTHANFIATSRSIIAFEQLHEDETILAYLPMAWVGDFFLSFGMSLVGGYTVSCPESAGTVLHDLREIGPTYFFAPPRIWENLLTTVMIRMDDASWIKQRMFHSFMGLATRLHRKETLGEAPTLWERLGYRLGKLLVYGPLKDNLGLSRVRIAYTAGEAIGPEIFNFFRGLGINLKQLYGMTEASVFIALQRSGDVRLDTCGIPVPGVEIRIADNGEVLFRSPGAFKGYLKDDAATRDTIVEGWVKTGDAGFLDHDGHLKIIDRAKDVSRLEDGTIFAPKYIENKLKFSPFIKEAVAIGQSRPYVAAMICLDAESVGNWSERRNLAYSSYTDLAQKPEVLELIQREVEKVNRSLAEDDQLKGARIRKFLILHKELDPDDDEITRTRKVRRGFIAEKYQVLIEALYSGQPSVETEAKVTFEDGRSSIIRANLAIRECPGWSEGSGWQAAPPLAAGGATRGGDASVSPGSLG